MEHGPFKGKDKTQTEVVRNSDWTRTMLGLDTNWVILKNHIFGLDWVEGDWIQKSKGSE